ncbi:hypothetical protein [Allocoleopsis sp.]|uniref:hypothetical protein n=1 Tax=Allocoleopsis sp. TaxID=3088169 RepID=UPI002FD1C469
MKQGSLGSTYKFQPRQIVCLEHENTRLYTEVIEVVTVRQICWVRPLMLVVSPLGHDSLPAFSPEQLNLYDLRQGADLLWPVSLFRVALDTEVIPLLVQLDNPDEGAQVNNAEAHQQLSCFIRKVWLASKNAF